ncbi:MAG TPA: hypothetical protein VN577_08950 [Terriglobales bacterium]|nr:hypothetical protein [Terriglobales bacterium]
MAKTRAAKKEVVNADGKWICSFLFSTYGREYSAKRTDESLRSNVEFTVYGLDMKAPVDCRPTDQQLFDRLQELGRISQDEFSNRTNYPGMVAITGIEYDPEYKEITLRFSDAGEDSRPPVLKGVVSEKQLIQVLLGLQKK